MNPTLGILSSGVHTQKSRILPSGVPANMSGTYFIEYNDKYYLKYKVSILKGIFVCLLKSVSLVLN